MTAKTSKPAAKPAKSSPSKTPAAKPAPKSADKTSPAAKTGDLVKRASEVLKRYHGNVEQAVGEAGAQGDTKLAVAIKALGAPAKAAPAAPPPAAKPAPAAPKAKATKREVIPSDAKLTALFKDNPARPGTTAWKVRDLYRTCKTVGEWRERVAAAELDAGYLQNDVRRGLIQVG